MQQDSIYYDALELHDLKKGSANVQKQNDESIVIENFQQQNQEQLLNQSILNETAQMNPQNNQNERDALQNRMTIAQRKDLLLFKNIKESQHASDNSILEEIQQRIDNFKVQHDQYTHITKLRIIQCQKDILPSLRHIIIYQRFCQKKINSKIQLKSITIKNSHFNGAILKEIIKAFKDSLQSIVIEDSYPINQQRNECLVDLFIRSSVKPKRLPNIKFISLSLMNLQDNQENLVQEGILPNESQFQQNINQNQNNQTNLNNQQNGQNNISNQQIAVQNQQNNQNQQQNVNVYEQNMIQNQQNVNNDLQKQKNLEEDLEKKTYNQLVERIIEDFKLHLVMSENYFRNAIDFESKFLLRQLTLKGESHKIVIDQKCFNLREHYRYFKEYIQLNKDIVEVVLFVNIGRIDLYIFKDILVQLRRVKNLKQLCFVRFQIEQNILQLIKNFLYWRDQDLQELYFIQCSLNDLDLKFLFQKNNLQITDYPLLNKIVINDNPLVTKEYMMPILYQLEEWKAERIKNNIYKYPLKFNIFETNSQYQKHFKLRKRPEIITEGGVICKENESFLIKYLTDFFQNSLILDYFPLDQALQQTIFLLFSLIRTSKSLCKLSLRNTNLLNLNIPLRQDNQEILSFIEEIDLSENSFAGQHKMATFFSHVNISHMKKLKLQKMDFDDFDFEDLPTILGISKNLKVLDLSGTQGFRQNTLLSIIENIPNVEELYLRDCSLNEQILSALNQRLYLEATAAFEDHQKKQKHNFESLLFQDDQKFLMSSLRIIDLSENREMGQSLIDLLMYLNALSYQSNITLLIENIDLSIDQIKLFLEYINQKRITNIEIINISKNYLERVNAELLANFLIGLVRENRKHLRQIIMKDTQLTVDQLIQIDKIVLDKSRLANIENLDLSGIGQLSLQELCFRGIFKNLSLYSKTITTLIWDNIGINNLSGLDLSQIISQFYMLEKFDISNNLYLTEKNIKEIILGLSSLKHLTEFKMQNMGLNDQQMTCLVDALMGRISTASSKYTIEEDFQENSTFQSLQVLDMSGNKFCDHNQWKRFFYVVLSSQYNRLTTLILKNIHLDDLIAQNLATVINERYQQIRIQSIDISHNTQSLTDNMFVSLINSFQKIKQLRKLYCRNVQLNSYKIQALCALILSNQMELLDVSENGPSSKMVFSETVQYKQVSSDSFIPSQSLTNLFGCISGSFTYEHLQKILKQQELMDDPKRQFDIVADDENGQKCPSIKESNIVKLNLSNNEMLSYYDFRKIIKSINYIGSSNICHLTIKNSQLCGKLDLLNDFLSKKINKLYYIDVSHNPIQSKYSQKFLEIISHKFSDHMEYLDISYTDFCDDELFYLSHTLAQSFLNLNYANFSGLQHISPKCLQGLLTGLTLASQVSLETLVIRDLKINQKKQDVLVEMFTFNIFKTLRHLDLSYNQFINEDFETLIRSISISCGQSLKSINLSYCDLNQISIQMLAIRFYEAGFQILESLDISGNKVYKQGTIIIPNEDIVNLIVKIHKINGSKFKKLFMRDMNLKDEWILAMKQVFDKLAFDSLEVLDISQNKLEQKVSYSQKTSDKIVSRKVNCFLTKETFIPFYEMIHFKFQMTFNYLDFKEMEIESNEETLKQLPHVVLKFTRLETFIFSRNIQEFLTEQRSISQQQFKQKYFGNQVIYQEILETVSKSIRYLDLQAQQLADSTLFSLKFMKNLEYLDLSYNKLITFQTLLNVKNCINLQTLKLFEINSDIMMIQTLINLLQNAPNCIDLTFDFDSISKAYKKQLLEANFRQPILKQFIKEDQVLKNLSRLNQEPQLQIERINKNILNLAYRFLPKGEVIYANNLLFEFLKEGQKINLSLDLQYIQASKKQIQSLHCIYPIEDFSFEEMKQNFRNYIKSGILFLNRAFINKFLQIYPVQPAQEDYVLYFLNERFFQICKESNIKQIIVDHPLYLLQPLFYSKDSIVNIFQAAKECGLQKIYLDYNIEFNVTDENIVVEFFDLIPPSSFKFLQATFSFSFIQYIYQICHQHPYFKNCDIRYISIKENTDELAVIYRERYYKLPDIRLGKTKEIWNRFLYFILDNISRCLYDSNFITGISVLNDIKVNLNWLILWYFLLAFFLITQQLIIYIFYVNIILMVVFLAANYFVEFYLHFKIKKDIPDCFSMTDEITMTHTLKENCFKYIFSQVIALNTFFIFFLVRLCFEQDQLVFGFFIFGWILMCQIVKIAVNLKQQIPIPYLIQFEVVSTLYDQLTIENYVVIQNKKLNRRAVNATIIMVIELFPSLIFYITFLGISQNFKVMSILGLICNLLNFLYQISLILMIKPFQINQMDFDVLSDQQQSQIELKHNYFTQTYEQESLNALSQIKTIFKPIN
ncbi:transmembrane protein, putative (macronuclear) [Tetrahymena thermophila SB210]|uniref:Transmembrane protein, putative n=1 Tax=Tetrahymena thermophila (strain SB210) TaxID=312017 RepID=I7M9R8_TETTS|nr:transmembrane protein, putative [Tetrahymena thermophila SB210]EAS02686.2 transmembrane protein, putative [Tetrahymena thermophila SB210]|eukprot:XP_001022931.2 transmembrane protein, putative [Tetrahymena thermophila SB210]